MPRPRLEVLGDAIRIVDSKPTSRFVAYAPRPELPLSLSDWKALRACMAAGPELADLLERIHDAHNDSYSNARDFSEKIAFLFQLPATQALLARIATP